MFLGIKAATIQLYILTLIRKSLTNPTDAISFMVLLRTKYIYMNRECNKTKLTFFKFLRVVRLTS
jgi:hypothetical protein